MEQLCSINKPKNRKDLCLDSLHNARRCRRGVFWAVGESGLHVAVMCSSLFVA